MNALVPYRIYIMLGLAVVLTVGSFASGWRVRALKADSDRLAAVEEAQRSEREAVARVEALRGRQVAATTQIETRYIERAGAVRTITQTLTREVPRVVTVEIDHSFLVPYGLVRLHDAAIAGIQPDAVPNPSNLADDAPSGVATSALAATLVGNYGICHATSEQLTALQDWIRAQQALAVTAQAASGSPR